MTGLTASQQVVFDMIAVSAEEGRVCPSNSEFAVVLGLASAGHVPEILKQLEQRGLIRVERGAVSRVVTVLATGDCTAGVVKSAHWRFRPENAHRRHVRYSTASLLGKAKPKEETERRRALTRVDRDPCPRCGVRADVGCSHVRPVFGLSVSA